MNEEKLIYIIKPYFDSCRPGDWNHALRVVTLVKELGKDQIDLDKLIVAAYLHDVGWSGVMKLEKVNFNEMLKLEPTANKNTPILVKEILEKLNYNKNYIDDIIRLINAADKHAANSKDEEIIVDADSLSKLCIEHVQEKYSKNSYKEIIALWEKELPNRMKTPTGKEKYLPLLNKLKEKLIL
jgi:hypothetical protein